MSCHLGPEKRRLEKTSLGIVISMT